MATPRCSSVADPFLQETLYSWLCRIGLLSQFDCDNSFLRQFMGYRGEQLTSIFPSYVTHLSKYSGISAQELLNQHSTLPYFRPFIRSDVYSQALCAMGSPASCESYAKFSLLANRIPEQNLLFYCPECATTDLKSVGVVYWHREHQLPWVNYCYIHGGKLVGIVRKRKALVLPPQTPKSTSKSAKKTLTDERLHKLAIESARLLYRNHIELQPERIKATYLSALKLKNLLTTEGNVKQAKWRRELERLWSDLIPEKVSSILFANKTFHPFPINLIYQPEAQHHPLKHLIVILHLFGDFEQFLDAYRSQVSVVKRTPHIVNASKISDERVEALVHHLKNGGSLRQAAKTARVSVGFAKSTAIKNDIKIERRAQSLFATERKQIKDILKTGITTQEIAHMMSCSIGAVEQILNQFPEIRQLRADLRFYQRRNTNRQRINTYLNENTKATRVQVRDAESAAYYWCYKNDKDWLYVNLPKPIPRAERNKKKS